MICFWYTLTMLTPVQEDMKVLTKVASSPALLEDVSLLDPLMATEGWQTLMTFVRESARKSPHLSDCSSFADVLQPCAIIIPHQPWMKIFLKTYWIKLPLNKQLPAVAAVLAFALIVRLRMLMEETTAKFAGCPYNDVQPSRNK